MLLQVEPSGFLLAALAADDDQEVASLAARVARLESRRTDAARRALRACQALPSWRRRWVPSDYYSRSMEARARLLNCDVRQMCKTMLLENRQRKGDFYLVVVQYVATFSAARLKDALAQASGSSKSSFNFRVADDCAALTGYEHGAVTPFGVTGLPVVLASAAARAPYGIIWMGGGHPDLKLGCSVADFRKAFDPLVLDVSDERRDEADDAAALLDLVVGRVLDARPHPDSDKLLIENIDCGSYGVRQILSGLRPHFSADDLAGRLVLVVANLKPKKLAGLPSDGMLLCATSNASLLLVDPPADAVPGDRVVFAGLVNGQGSTPASPAQCDKLQLFAKAQPHFVVRGGLLFFKDHPFDIPDRGVCSCLHAQDGASVS